MRCHRSGYLPGSSPHRGRTISSREVHFLLRAGMMPLRSQAFPEGEWWRLRGLEKGRQRPVLRLQLAASRSYSQRTSRTSHLPARQVSAKCRRMDKKHQFRLHPSRIRDKKSCLCNETPYLTTDMKSQKCLPHNDLVAIYK